VKPRKPSPTIYDVAHATNLSITTVSRVLNNPEKVSKATREKVMAAIEELGFIPKAEARARSLKSAGRIGVITPFFTAPSFVQRLRGIASTLSPTNYELVIYTVDSGYRLDDYLDTLPLVGNLSGVILISLQLSEEQSQRLLDSGIPAVLIEFPQSDFSTVEINDVQGGSLAAEYLVSKGHQLIAFMGDTDIPEYGIHPISLRLVGFRQGLEKHKIALEHVFLTPYSHEDARKAAEKLLQQPNPPTAIFAATDLQAIGVIRAARELGMRIPQDLAVLGFDDLDIAEYVGLSTIRQPLDESGRVAIELLMARLNNPERPIQHVRLPLTVIQRQTA
jgi:DNA-binding LacI/PurR family transcriptional regulator